ncbi:MAG: EamA family transporter [Desulfurococcales archaeon]|nr:EamA family transporter [Desulfurococcales archaeon]
MERWVIEATITLLAWGLWGLALKIASRDLQWFQVYFYAGLATVLAIVLVGIYYHDELSSTIQGKHKLQLLVAFTSGALGAIGYITLVRALNSGGPASIVIPFTALYPLITAILSILLIGESVTLRKAIGIVLAIIAIALLSMEE